MDARTHHPSIPAEALARQARLSALLAAMEQGSASREPSALRALQDALRGAHADPAALVQSLVEDDLIEEGACLVRADRQRSNPQHLQQISALLTPLAARAQKRREATWQLDTRRACVRVGYAKEGEAIDFDEGEVHAILLQAFRLEGIRLALDLGKRPRPALHLELPVPSGAGGLCEWAEVVFRVEPAEPPEALMSALNDRLPEGLRIHRWESHPPYASSLADLAEASHWRWTCPADRADDARKRTGAFLSATEWLWEKEGRIEGRKQVKPLDLRPLVMELRWEGDVLISTTRTRSSEPGNPLKIHAAILGLEPAALRGLMRQVLDLKPDPRLAQADRFEPKLKNMYEDAVLLGGGSNITLVDEDDDEPIQLG
ncbi:TIGR03936 family radical SAM-associated protein [Geothrix paludis]|uniref:TIGR03936 family radical SAM-associated protein n=1 Tax=Geothrix paludis TaxID=2922722 RepID=UPI001FADFDB1